MPDPNVLLITTDHWSGELLGSAGHPVIQTPTLDALARDGVSFTRAYSECPVCIPARRSLMTGTSPRTHGDRVFDETRPMPDVPSLAQTFRDAGYQAYGVGKLHVYPARDRIGFDDVLLAEEGRTQHGSEDDYELHLGDRGHPGQQFSHGMGNNDFVSRPWHLDEQLHVTNWITQGMARTIRRRDPSRPAFWYLSYTHPHPPLAPLASYLDIYRELEPDEPFAGSWAENSAALPHPVRANRSRWLQMGPLQARLARRAFYALCTHIDHQLRVVIGTLREEGLLDQTIILFTSDHGEMRGNHGLWVKRLFYESAARVPMILLDTGGSARVRPGSTDDRLVCLQDVMPTLLDLAGLDTPSSVEGLSMVGNRRRDYLYGEFGEGAAATRMVHDGRHKLIYYPAGNQCQLFDLREDPQELQDLAVSTDYGEVLARLKQRLIGELYGSDGEWLHDGSLAGVPAPEFVEFSDRGLSSQRGVHWPRPQVKPDSKDRR
ncbi:MAG: sulfatase-like hydrolase/transferase [Trueperaceae bacterium]